LSKKYIYLSLKKRNLLVNLIYNLTLSNLKKSKKPFKLILANLLQDLVSSNLKKSKKPFTYAFSNLKKFKKVYSKAEIQIKV
jgi:hypothetical protein